MIALSYNKDTSTPQHRDYSLFGITIACSQTEYSKSTALHYLAPQLVKLYLVLGFKLSLTQILSFNVELPRSITNTLPPMFSIRMFITIIS